MKELIVIGPIILATLNSAWLEGANGNCAAVERLAVRKTTKPGEGTNPFVTGFMALSDGRLAAQMASENVPGVPAPLPYLIVYWQRR
ncbi:hypothetical protein Q2941_37140 [Bradyrhizobium sp. UFLA05-153]